MLDSVKKVSRKNKKIVLRKIAHPWVLQETLNDVLWSTVAKKKYMVALSQSWHFVSAGPFCSPSRNSGESEQRLLAQLQSLHRIDDARLD